MNRYPVLGPGPIRQVKLPKAKTIKLFLIIIREMYEAQEWINNISYHSPTAIGSDGNYIFIGDIVTLEYQGVMYYGSVVTFVQQVTYYVCRTYIKTFEFTIGMQKITGKIQAELYLIAPVTNEDDQQCYMIIVEEIYIDVANITSVITECHPFTRYNICIKFPDSEPVLLDNEVHFMPK